MNLEGGFKMWVENKKHRWELNSRGEVDEFAFSEGYHNGPACVKCEQHFCIHCEGKAMNKDCDGIDYICSVCGQVVVEKSKFCPECGTDNREEVDENV